MSRAKKEPLAIAGIPNLPAAGSTISRTQAIQIAKQVGAKLLRDVKSEQREKRAELAKTVGGQISRVDDSVLAQARTLMARLALISQTKKSGSGYHSAPNKLDGVVGKMGAIVGELEAMMLTDRALGLFEEVREYDYTGHSYSGATSPSEAVGIKARDAASEVLKQFTIVDDEAPTKGRRGQKNVTPAEATKVFAADVSDEAIDDLDAAGDIDDAVSGGES